MKKAIMYRSLILLFTFIMLTPVSLAFAATDYTGGLFDGKPLNISISPDKYAGTTTAATDNDEATFAIMEAGSSDNVQKDGLIYDFDTPVEITGYRLKIDSKEGVHIAFYKADGTKTEITGDSLSGNGTLQKISYKGIKKIHLLNQWETTKDKKVYEFNVYGNKVPDTPLNLVAVGGNAQVQLTWDKVNDATSYIVMRSTTPKGPYNTVATNVYGTSYLDTSVTNGTTYYYVIKAINATGESKSSNEASATPQAPEVPQLNRAILTITFTTGLEKEFDLSMTEVSAFINWYEQKASGSGSVTFAIDKHENNKGPFSSRKDYIVFDKVLTFQVNEYDVK